MTAFFLGHAYIIMGKQCFYHLRAICIHFSDFLDILIDQLIKFVRGCDRHRYKMVVLHMLDVVLSTSLKRGAFPIALHCIAAWRGHGAC